MGRNGQFNDNIRLIVSLNKRQIPGIADFRFYRNFSATLGFSSARTMYTSHFYTVSEHCRLHYLQIGNGPRLVLAFHGYGNSADMFRFLDRPGYTVLSIDLPYHGNSCWQGQLSLDKAQLRSMVLQLMQIWEAERVSLAGYSMGGRVCLVICELLAERVDKVVLLAPDGLRFNYFYYFLTRTRLGHFLFRDFSKRSHRYRRYLSWIGTLRLVSRPKYRFAQMQIRTPEAVQFLNNTWNSTKQLIPDQKLVRQQIREYRVPVHMIMGMYDRIIPLKLASQFQRECAAATVQVHPVPRGHLLYEHPDVQEETCKWLFNPST